MRIAAVILVLDIRDFLYLEKKSYIIIYTEELLSIFMKFKLTTLDIL